MAYPISCNECRRRKIRCDRVHPCKNCSRKAVQCSYPKQFRSIDINHLKSSSVSKPENLATPEKENLSMLKRYEQRIRELETKLAVSEDLISIFDTNGGSGYTTGGEWGLKYFGANSINSLENSIMPGLIDFGKGKERRDINRQKKTLPALVDDPEENMRLIFMLVDLFFDMDEYTFFSELLDEGEIRTFLHEYNSIVDWHHDEQVMLVQVLIIDVLKGRVDYKKDPQLFPNMAVKLREVIVQYYQVSKLQPSESTNLVKSQILLASYYYYKFDLDKSWKLLFQIVSNAFSLGIHITQGPIWSNINLLESILCSLTSRPNILSNYLMKREIVNYGEHGEYEFAELLRLKNRIYVESFIEKKPVEFSEILKLDQKFDVYYSFLKQKLTVLESDPHKTVGQHKIHQYLQILLLLTVSFQMNLHFELFETQPACDRKTMTLIESFIEIFSKVVKPNELYRLRHKFAPLECVFYHFLLIFLKFLNYKNMKFLMSRGVNSYTANYDANLHGDIKKLVAFQEEINKIRKDNPSYHGVRVLKVLEVIETLNIDEFNALDNLRKENISYESSIIGTSSFNGSPTDSPATLLGYSNEEVKNLFEDEGILIALRDVSKLLPSYIDNGIDGPNPLDGF